VESLLLHSGKYNNKAQYRFCLGIQFSFATCRKNTNKRNINPGMIIYCLYGALGPNRVGISLPYMKMETDPVIITLSFIVIYNSGRWTKSTNLAILSTIDHV
jgi:hypothetical protein